MASIDIETAYICGSCFLGCFVLYMLCRRQKKLPLSLFETINIDVKPNTGKPAVIFLDMLISSSIGTALVMLIAAPISNAQATICGLGIIGLASGFAKEV